MWVRKVPLNFERELCADEDQLQTSNDVGAVFEEEEEEGEEEGGETGFLQSWPKLKVHIGYVDFLRRKAAKSQWVVNRTRR